MVPLEPRNPVALSQALSAVTRVQRVSLAQAAALGFWDESQPDDNPPLGIDGKVEVPAWRHAVINYPHPLLERGLVVIDTPGLNAIGAEPELTLGLLPRAHAVVFVLAADTGVTRSDLTIWRDHLGQASQERFVVLNKIDALLDPLGTMAEVQAQIEHQRLGAARRWACRNSACLPVGARSAGRAADCRRSQPGSQPPAAAGMGAGQRTAAAPAGTAGEIGVAVVEQLRQSASAAWPTAAASRPSSCWSCAACVARAAPSCA
jgi:hypothetical protein